MQLLFVPGEVPRGEGARHNHLLGRGTEEEAPQQGEEVEDLQPVCLGRVPVAVELAGRGVGGADLGPVGRDRRLPVRVGLALDLLVSQEGAPVRLEAKLLLTGGGQEDGDEAEPDPDKQFPAERGCREKEGGRNVGHSQSRLLNQLDGKDYPVEKKNKRIHKFKN